MDDISMEKKGWIIAISIAFFILITTMVGLYIYYQFAPFCCKYDVTIERSYNSSLESQAINESENLDIAEILQVGRYTDWNKDFSDPPKGKTDYVWPNVIDNTSLSYYKDKISRLRETNTRVLSEYTYEVKCEYVMNYTIKVQKESLDLNSSIINNFSQCATLVGNILTVVNETTKDVIHSNISGYYIEQSFDYEETYGPLAGFGGEVKQKIILNEEFKPIIVISEFVEGWIS
jgi:hypothetical protein